MFESIFRELEEREVKYLVIGGIAVNFHGYDRVTGDLDILVGFEKDNLAKFITAIKSLGWTPRLPVSLEAFANAKNRKVWKNKKGMKVFTIYNPKNEPEHVDVMTEDYIDFEQACRNKNLVFAKGIRIPLASIPDLIRLKKAAGRERDKVDIMALKKIMELKSEKKKANRNEFDEDHLKRYMALSPEEKLKYLEEMNAFLAAFTPPEAKKMQQELKEKGW